MIKLILGIKIFYDRENIVNERNNRRLNRKRKKRYTNIRISRNINKGRKEERLAYFRQNLVALTAFRFNGYGFILRLPSAVVQSKISVRDPVSAYDDSPAWCVDPYRAVLLAATTFTPPVSS